MSPDRQFAHMGSRIDLQAILAGEIVNALRRPFRIQAGQRAEELPTAPGAFDAQHDIFGDRENGDQHEVLMHHADAVGNGIVGIAEAHRLTVHQNLTFVRLIQAIQHIHQSAFAGAVFSKQRMDFAVLQRKVDMIVC
jgi:hypothetical protein